MFEKGSDITHQTWNKHSSSDYSAHKALYSVCQKPLFSPYPQFPGWPDGEGTFASLRQTLFPEERHIDQRQEICTVHTDRTECSALFFFSIGSIWIIRGSLIMGGQYIFHILYSNLFSGIMHHGRSSEYGVNSAFTPSQIFVFGFRFLSIYHARGVL